MNFNIFRKNFKPDDVELGLLFDNLDLILKNQDIIITHSDFYNIWVSGVSFANYKITLGELLKLWKDKETYWRINDRFYYFISGFSLSGNNRCAYFDRKQGYQCKYSSYFTTQKTSASKLLKKRDKNNQNQFIIPNPQQSCLSLEYLIYILP